MKRQSSLTSIILIVIGLVIVIYVAWVELIPNEYCNPYDVWRVQREMDKVHADIVDAENLLQNGPLPVHVMAQLDHNVYLMGYWNPPECTYAALQEISCALMNFIAYAKSGDAAIRVQYDGCLSRYYLQSSRLDDCWPLCQRTVSQ